MVRQKARQAQNRRHVAEKEPFILFLSVPHRTPLRQSKLRWPSPEHSTVMFSQGKRRRHMNIPPPCVVGDSRSDLDQTLDEPFHLPFELFASKVDLPQHVEEVVGQDSHEQPGLFCWK